MSDISYKPLIQDMVWSYSRLKCFEDCPYRWYLKYIRFPKHRGKDLFFSGYGKFMHELIARYHLGDSSSDDLAMEYLRSFRNRVTARAPNEKIFQNYFLDGLRYLKTLSKPKNKIVLVEGRVEFNVGNIPFVGYIDLLEEDDENTTLVVDNKSRSLKPRSGKSKPTIADKELDEYLRQLYLYSVAVKDKYGKFPKKLCFECFRQQIRIEEPFDVGAYENTLVWTKDCVSKITEETEFKPNMEYFKCRYLCDMQDLCDYYRLSRG